jgi:hypothetical protein
VGEGSSFKVLLYMANAWWFSCSWRTGSLRGWVPWVRTLRSFQRWKPHTGHFLLRKNGGSARTMTKCQHLLNQTDSFGKPSELLTYLENIFNTVALLCLFGKILK